MKRLSAAGSRYGGECTKAGEAVSKTAWVGSIPNRPCQMPDSDRTMSERIGMPDMEMTMLAENYLNSS